MVHAEPLGGVAFSEGLRSIPMVYLVLERHDSRRGEKYCRVCLKPLKYVKGLFERSVQKRINYLKNATATVQFIIPFYSPASSSPASGW